MFSSLGLFDKTTCPMGVSCDLPNCIFAHEKAQTSRTFHQRSEVEDEHIEKPNKRRKVSEGATRVNQVLTRPKIAPFLGRLVQSSPVSSNEVDDLEDDQPRNIKDIECRKSKKLSPPPRKRPLHSTIPNNAGPSNVPEIKSESLNPRTLIKPPATHASRMVYLKKLHEFLSRLNELAGKSKDTDMQALKIGDAQLIKLALDEEMKIASENTSVYPNIIKLRMVALSKMTLEQWKAERLQASFKEELRATKLRATDERDLSTGLSAAEEVQILPSLFAKQQGLEPYGFVTSPPTVAEITAAKEGVEASQGWEECDRCKSRFQVFPNRRADGSLTSGGVCTYHHGRANFPERDSARPSNGNREKIYTCCNEPMGISPGCSTHNTHVFKINDGKRLASVLQYEHTPTNPEIPADRAVAFDCEMAYTVHGMELIRITATSWPNGEVMLDVLVKPLGAILDLNTRYSGVKPDDYVNAIPFSEAASKDTPKAGQKESLRIVESPMSARNLLFKLISPSTPLIGHAIENDLNASRIVHPSIIDTVLLFPARGGLPRRRALRVLAKDMLWRAIQVAGADGHDSKEDAVAAGDLVRLTVGRHWRQMRSDGYIFQRGILTKPQ